MKHKAKRRTSLRFIFQVSCFKKLIPLFMADVNLKIEALEEKVHYLVGRF